MKNPMVRHCGLSKGFSLVELMVAMVLGLLLLAGVVSAFIANRQVYRTNENMSRLQETARIVNELMGRDIRAAGGNPCGVPQTQLTNSLPNSNWWSDWGGGTLIGYDDNQPASAKAFGNGTGDRIQGTDAILVLSATYQEGWPISSSSAPNFTLSNPNHGISVNDILVVCSPSGGDIFSVTKVTGNVIEGGSTGTNGTTLTPLNASFWYIGNNNEGGRSLYRFFANNNNLQQPQEIVEGITDMQIEYLTRNNSGTLANSYVNATTITSGSGWSNSANPLVVAVRVTLTLQTMDNVATGGSQPVTRTISFTTSIRNREVVQ